MVLIPYMTYCLYLPHYNSESIYNHHAHFQRDLGNVSGLNWDTDNEFINKYKSKQGPLTINELHNDSTARFYECYCEFLP